MSYTDLRDFEPEFTAIVDGLTVEIEKLGGGTVGKTYVGTWRYIITDDAGNEIARGQELVTNLPYSHAEAADLLLAFLALDEQA